MRESAGVGLILMTWRERIVRARERERRWPRWLRWYPRSAFYWPFTEDDYEAWASIETCAAARVVEDYGLDWSVVRPVWNLGTPFFHAMVAHDVAGAERILDDMEDLALRIKREGGALR
jgi:hypothetical protein